MAAMALPFVIAGFMMIPAVPYIFYRIAKMYFDQKKDIERQKEETRRTCPELYEYFWGDKD